MTTGEQIPQQEALRMQLAAIAGNEPPTSYFEIRAKRSRPRGGMHQDFIPINEKDRAARSAHNLGQTHDTYIGVAPRTRRNGTADAIERVWCVWADCDGRESLERLAHFTPLPGIVIRSGSEHSAHAYWPLRQPVPPEWARRANHRLRVALGADNATDPARILRPAGTLNFKHGAPRPVVCTRLELDVFTVADVVGHLPDDRAYVAPPKPLRVAYSAADASNALDGLVRKVAENSPDSKNRNNALYRAGCRLREHVDAGGVAEHEGREALRAAGLSTGLPEVEVERTLDSALKTKRAAA